MTDWNGWFGKAKRKLPYIKQKTELFNLLNRGIQKKVEAFNFASIKSVLDVGGGDGRLKQLFIDKEYKVLDLETTGDDLTKKEGWKFARPVDLSICNLFLVCLNEKEATFVLEQALRLSKWVLIFDETTGIESPINEDKYNHDYYYKFPENHTKFFDVVSRENPAWRVYLFKGIR